MEHQDRQGHLNPLTQRLESAAQALQDGDFDRAGALLEQVLDAEPDQPDALHFLGILRHRQGDASVAESLIRRALARAPDHPSIVLNLGNVLYESGHAPEAIEAFRQAIDLDPANSSAWHNLGTALHGVGNLAEARFAWQHAVEADATNAEAWFGLSRTLIELGDVRAGLLANSRAIALWPQHLQAREQVIRALVMLGERERAAVLYREWLAEQPDNVVIRHQLAAIGETPAPDRASDAYVETVFDSFAPHFDGKLGALGYQAPGHVARALATRVAAEGRLDVADLGCGTGLCGPLLRPYARHLVGCDLSTGMLQQARTRGCYDALFKVELVYFLQHEPRHFDALACADTLCYFGPLDAVCQAAAAALRACGVFVFTTEALGDDATLPFEIRPSGRYAHRGDYLADTLRAAGFSQVDREPVTLRQEAGEPVRGWLVAACWP